MSLAISRPSEEFETTIFSALKFVQAAGIVFLFLVPLAMILVWPSLPNPFLVAKTEAFRWCAGLSALCAGAYALSSQKRISPIIWAFALFVLIIAVADALAPYPSQSFFGTPIRMEGFGEPLSGLLYLGALAVLLDTTRLWKSFIAVWAVSGVIVAGSGGLQLADAIIKHEAPPLLWGVTGEHVFLGAYMLFGMAFSAWSFFLANSGKGRALAAVASAACLFIFMMSGARAAFAGFAVGAPLAVLMLYRARGNRPWLALGGIVVLCLMNAQMLAERLQAVPADLHARFSCWHNVWAFISLRPLTGWGQDSLNVMCNVGTMEIWDRMHNFALQQLADGGIPLLGAYALFIALVSVALLRIPRREAALAAGAIVAYIISLMFEPEIIVTMVPFLTVTGWVAWRSSQTEAANG